MIVDTHAHLDFKQFKDDRDDVVAKARDAGVHAIINPGCDVQSSRRAVELAEQYDMVYAAVGIHPNDAGKVRAGDIDEIARLAEHERVVAIGEIGLDYYRDRAPRDRQAEVFREQLDLAVAMGLPVIIHFRDVEREGIETAGAGRMNAVRGVFHCFGGSPQFALEVTRMGYFIGFDGPLTYPKSDRPAVASAVPIQKCLVETDAPFLTPQRKRGTRNEPALVRDVLETLAQLKGLSLEEAAEITSDNAAALFMI